MYQQIKCPSCGNSYDLYLENLEIIDFFTVTIFEKCSICDVILTIKLRMRPTNKIDIVHLSSHNENYGNSRR